MQIVVFMFLSQTWLNQHVIIRQEWYSGLVSRCTKANMRQSSLSSNPLQKKEKKRKANRQTSISVSLNCSWCSMKTMISHHIIKQSLRHAPNECNFYTEWKSANTDCVFSAAMTELVWFVMPFSSPPAQLLYGLWKSHLIAICLFN